MMVFFFSNSYLCFWVIVVEKIIKQSKKYTFKDICKSYKLLNIADLELKNSQKEPQIILEELVMNIINQDK